MAIRIRISLAMEHARLIVTPITLTSSSRMSRQRPARPHRACFWSTRCICATPWRREWTPSHTVYTHSKLSYHKVWKIWVISKLPDRPMSVNWCFILFASVLKTLYCRHIFKKIPCTFCIDEKHFVRFA